MPQSKAMERSSPSCKKQTDEEAPKRKDLHAIGTLCTVKRIENRTGGAQVVLQGISRVVIGKTTMPRSYLRVEYEPLENLATVGDEGLSAEGEALHRENTNLVRKIANLVNEEKGEQIFPAIHRQRQEPGDTVVSIRHIRQCGGN